MTVTRRPNKISTDSFLFIHFFIYYFFIYYLFSGPTVSPVSCIDVHFDDAASGFFIKKSETKNDDIGGGELVTSMEEDDLSSNLTVLRTSEMISLKASYGPFFSRERVAGGRGLGRRHVWLLRVCTSVETQTPANYMISSDYLSPTLASSAMPCKDGQT